MEPVKITGGNVEDGDAASVMRKIRTTPVLSVFIIGIFIILISTIFTSIVTYIRGIDISSLPTEPWLAPISQSNSSWRLLLNSFSIITLSWTFCLRVFSWKRAKKISLSLIGIVLAILIALSLTPLFSWTSLFDAHGENVEANFSKWAEQRYGIVLDDITSVNQGSIIKDTKGNEYRIYTGNEGSLLYDTEITSEVPRKAGIK